MTKAQEKLSRAEALAEVYDDVVRYGKSYREQIGMYLETIEELRAENPDLQNGDFEDLWRVQSSRDSVAKCEMKAKAMDELANAIYKMM